MIKKKNGLELAMAVITPFLGIISIALIQFVTFGLKMPDSNWYWQLAVNVLAMICFWLPGRIIAVQKAKESERTKSVEARYMELTDSVYDGRHINELRAWCERYTDTARCKYVAARLEMACISLERYNAEFRANNKAIKCDKLLSSMQKKYLRNANMYVNIKPLTVERLLPNINMTTEYDLCEESYARASRWLAVRKIFMSCVFGIALGAIVVAPSTGVDVVSIITPLAVKLFTGALHFMLGITSGRMLIDKHYIGDLSLKTERLQEFHATIDSTNQLSK